MTAQEFSSLVLSEQRGLKSYAKLLTKNTDDANDLVQETLLKAYHNRDSYQTQTSIKAWLYTIMKNSFINHYRRMMKRNTFIDTTDNMYYIDSPFIQLDSKAENTFLKKELKKALDSIPYSLKEVFLLHYQGYKYHELAEYYKIPIGTIKTRIHMARKALKKMLESEGEAYGLTLD